MALETAHDDVELTFEAGGRDPGVGAGGHVLSQRGGILADTVEALGARVALLHVSEVAGRHRVLASDQQGVQLEERLFIRQPNRS